MGPIVLMGVAPAIQTASIGVPDTLFLMLLALVVFGPRRLPEIGRQIGKLMYEFRKVSNDFKFQMEEELRASEEADRKKKQAEAAAALPALNPPQPEPPPAIESALLSEPELAVPQAEPMIPMQLEPATAAETNHYFSIHSPSFQAPTGGEVVPASRPFQPKDPEPQNHWTAESANGVEPEAPAESEAHHA